MRLCQQAVKLSGKRTRFGRASGKSLDTDGANRVKAVNLSGSRQRAHIDNRCAPFLLNRLD
jgi:hypothetical protein